MTLRIGLGLDRRNVRDRFAREFVAPDFDTCDRVVCLNVPHNAFDRTRWGSRVFEFGAVVNPIASLTIVVGRLSDRLHVASHDRQHRRDDGCAGYPDVQLPLATDAYQTKPTVGIRL